MGIGRWLKLKDNRKSELNKESKTDKTKEPEKIKEIPDKKMDLFQPAESIEDEKS